MPSGDGGYAQCRRSVWAGGHGGVRRVKLPGPAWTAKKVQSHTRQTVDVEYKIIEVTEALVNRAMALAETSGLRGYDAVQLAAALEVHTSYRVVGLPPITLISADAELNTAATAQGLTVEDPNTHP